MIQKGTELFNMWADAYRLFDRYSEPPKRGASDEDEFWRGLVNDSRELCEVKYGKSKHKNAYALIISGIISCIETMVKEK